MHRAAFPLLYASPPALAPGPIFIADYAPLADLNGRQKSERADTLSTHGPHKSAERRALARAQPIKDAIADVGLALDLMPATKKRLAPADTIWNAYRLFELRLRV